MHETNRLVEAANALSLLLRNGGIPHAFYGSIFSAIVTNAPFSDEIFCIVEGGLNQAHPFRRVRDATAGNEHFTITHSPWTNRLIEILPAGETGPRHLDATTVMKIQQVPFLTVTEFIRAKLKTWVIGGSDRDSQDITFALIRYWNRVDINRITEQDMNVFVSRNPAAAPAWTSLRRKYGV
ncbi:hypothetical protein BJ165DRAFT_1335041 [Panaeolus papilionaceus]|nr:hypothetical protein BJ165DRAFT_1335041 [Panaeolus papilionaceus]